MLRRLAQLALLLMADIASGQTAAFVSGEWIVSFHEGSAERAALLSEEPDTSWKDVAGDLGEQLGLPLIASRRVGRSALLLRVDSERLLTSVASELESRGAEDPSVELAPSAAPGSGTIRFHARCGVDPSDWGEITLSGSLPLQMQMQPGGSDEYVARVDWAALTQAVAVRLRELPSVEDVELNARFQAPDPLGPEPGKDSDGPLRRRIDPQD